MVITADCIFKRANIPSKTESPSCENTVPGHASPVAYLCRNPTTVTPWLPGHFAATPRASTQVLIRAATVMVITADCIFKRTTSPSKTEVSHCENTAASGASRALVVFVTHGGGLNRRRRRWRGRRRVGRVPTFLDRVRWLNGNATQPGFRVHITVHPHIALFSPV
nr:hypothetical protein Iba_chr14cCG12350 [Ipomoea batatas]